MSNYESLVALQKELISSALSENSLSKYPSKAALEVITRKLNLGRQKGNTNCAILALQDFKKDYHCIFVLRQKTDDQLLLDFVKDLTLKKSLLDGINFASPNLWFNRDFCPEKPVIIVFDYFDSSLSNTHLLYSIERQIKHFKCVFFIN